MAVARAGSPISSCSKRSTNSASRPVAIAGTSIGSLIGAAYAAGMPGREIRRHVIALAHNRAEIFRRLLQARAGSFASLLSIGFGSATQVDAEKFCSQFLPDKVPDVFEKLGIPLTVIASDLYARRQAVFSSGTLQPALAASIALPTVMRPVIVDDRVLIDGAATNPLPFDVLRGQADAIVAIDISGAPMEDRRDIPNPWECLATTVLVMGSAITDEKLKHGAPDLIVRPNVGAFRTLDFLQASAILRASEPVRAEVKTRVRRAARRLSGLPHVAAPAVVQGGIAEADPARGGEIADRDRLLLLQRHDEDFAVLGGVALGEGDALDLVALAHKALERLLLLRECGGRTREPEQSHYSGGQFMHEFLLESSQNDQARGS